jgi:hypothetical protein
MSVRLFADTHAVRLIRRHSRSQITPEPEPVALTKRLELYRVDGKIEADVELPESPTSYSGLRDALRRSR